jgi:uncharacterized protein YndB with AHSA1/START domain
MAMAINHVRSSLRPDEVFEHLLNPWEYPKWLLGASDMRAVDDDWPAVGSNFHHRVGWGPVKVNDRSQIVEIDPPRKLVLYVKATPLVQGEVTFTLEEVDGGTLLTLQEEPAIPAGNLARPVLDPATHARNKRSLHQLADLMHRGDGASAD